MNMHNDLWCPNLFQHELKKNISNNNNSRNNNNNKLANNNKGFMTNIYIKTQS